MNALVDRLSGKALRATDLEAIYSAYSDHPEFVGWAIAALDHLDAADLGYSLWLLRRAARANRAFSEDDIQRLLAMSDGLKHWVARVSFCQMMAAIKIPRSLVGEFFLTLEPFTSDRLPIARAWAISALYPLRNDLSVGGKVRKLVSRLKKEKSKAMQARFRRLRCQTRRERRG